jgi:hypothetical protein
MEAPREPLFTSSSVVEEMSIESESLSPTPPPISQHHSRNSSPQVRRRSNQKRYNPRPNPPCRFSEEKYQGADALLPAHALRMKQMHTAARQKRLERKATQTQSTGAYQSRSAQIPFAPNGVAPLGSVSTSGPYLHPGSYDSTPSSSPNGRSGFPSLPSPFLPLSPSPHPGAPIAQPQLISPSPSSVPPCPPFNPSTLPRELSSASKRTHQATHHPDPQRVEYHSRALCQRILVPKPPPGMTPQEQKFYFKDQERREAKRRMRAVQLTAYYSIRDYEDAQKWYKKVFPCEDEDANGPELQGRGRQVSIDPEPKIREIPAVGKGHPTPPRGSRASTPWPDGSYSPLPHNPYTSY